METSNSALILAGAAAKGPFAAGALSGLIPHLHKFNITRVVGASSGALNGAVFAAGLRVGREQEAAELLEELWDKRAGATSIISFKARKQIVLDALKVFSGSPTQREVRLYIVTTSLQGRLRAAGDVTYTTYEQPHTFVTEDFGNDERLETLAETALASAALPVVFSPSRISETSGQHWDGGIVNNAPISLALRQDPELEHLIVVTAAPAVVSHADKRFHRLSLSHLLNIAIDERLARDLHDARSFNEELVKLGDLVNPDEVRRVLGWRILKFIEIRPSAPLPGWVLSGFLSRQARKDYINQGRLAAAIALEGTAPVFKQPESQRVRKESASVSSGLHA